jgi:hypothetical protein
VSFKNISGFCEEKKTQKMSYICEHYFLLSVTSEVNSSVAKSDFELHPPSKILSPIRKAIF